MLWAASMQLDGSRPHKSVRPMLLSRPRDVFNSILFSFHSCAHSVRCSHVSCHVVFAWRFCLYLYILPTSFFLLRFYAFFLYFALRASTRANVSTVIIIIAVHKLCERDSRIQILFSRWYIIFALFSLFTNRDCHCTSKLTHSKTHEISTFSIAAIAKLKCSVIRWVLNM